MCRSLSRRKRNTRTGGIATCRWRGEDVHRILLYPHTYTHAYIVTCAYERTSLISWLPDYDWYREFTYIERYVTLQKCNQFGHLFQRENQFAICHVMNNIALFAVNSILISPCVPCKVLLLVFRIMQFDTLFPGKESYRMQIDLQNLNFFVMAKRKIILTHTHNK